MKIPTQKGKHSCNFTELSLRRKEGIKKETLPGAKDIDCDLVDEDWPIFFVGTFISLRVCPVKRINFIQLNSTQRALYFPNCFKQMF